MKQRVLVMNGQRLLQNEQGGQWATSKVDKAGAIKPGIYDIYLAGNADKAKTYAGVIVHADGASVYQQVGKTWRSQEPSATSLSCKVSACRTAINI